MKTSCARSMLQSMAVGILGEHQGNFVHWEAKDVDHHLREGVDEAVTAADQGHLLLLLLFIGIFTFLSLVASGAYDLV